MANATTPDDTRFDVHLQPYFGTTGSNWLHFVYTYGGAGQASKYYVNGAISTDAYTGQPASRVQTTVTCWGPIWFSKAGFNGDLDEIRMYTAAQSPAWVQLSYQNQRPDSLKGVTFVNFTPSSAKRIEPASSRGHSFRWNRTERTLFSDVSEPGAVLCLYTFSGKILARKMLSQGRNTVRLSTGSVQGGNLTDTLLLCEISGKDFRESHVVAMR